MDGPCEQVVDEYLSPAQGHRETFRNCKRTGSGRVIVTDISFENEQGLKVNEVAAGEPIVVVMSYETKGLTAEDRVSPSISFHTKSGVNLFHNYAHFSGKTFRDLCSEGQFRFTIDALDLVPDEYKIACRIIANGNQLHGELLDQPDTTTSLTVTASNFFGGGSALTNFGALLIRGTWATNCGRLQ